MKLKELIALLLKHPELYNENILTERGEEVEGLYVFQKSNGSIDYMIVSEFAGSECIECGCGAVIGEECAECCNCDDEYDDEYNDEDTF
jgi:hypothetical protein